VRTILPVLGQATSADGRHWVHVRLPGRPSGHKGWIAASRTRPATTGWYISVSLSARRVTVHRDGRVERRFKALVGKASTPTPRGHFFVEEALALSSRAAGGPLTRAAGAGMRTTASKQITLKGAQTTRSSPTRRVYTTVKSVDVASRP
jgi:hypothetical protein